MHLSAGADMIMGKSGVTHTLISTLGRVVNRLLDEKGRVRLANAATAVSRGERPLTEGKGMSSPTSRTAFLSSRAPRVATKQTSLLIYNTGADLMAKMRSTYTGAKLTSIEEIDEDNIQAAVQLLSPHDAIFVHVNNVEEVKMCKEAVAAIRRLGYKKCIWVVFPQVPTTTLSPLTSVVLGFERPGYDGIIMDSELNNASGLLASGADAISPRLPSANRLARFQGRNINFCEAYRSQSPNVGLDNVTGIFGDEGQDFLQNIVKDGKEVGWLGLMGDGG